MSAQDGPLPERAIYHMLGFAGRGETLLEHIAVAVR
jgi:hypothetical protein